MSGYTLTLFGGFELRDECGAPVVVASKKGRRLLACLKLVRGQSIPRNRLAALLWSDRDDCRRRDSLSQALFNLRALFPEEIQSGRKRWGERAI